MTSDHAVRGKRPGFDTLLSLLSTFRAGSQSPSLRYEMDSIAAMTSLFWCFVTAVYPLQDRSRVLADTKQPLQTSIRLRDASSCVPCLQSIFSEQLAYNNCLDKYHLAPRQNVPGEIQNIGSTHRKADHQSHPNLLDETLLRPTRTVGKMS